MASVDELNRQFAIPNVARFEPGGGNLPRLSITAPAGEGQIYVHGAHVSHFQPRGHKPVLFLSSRSSFENGKPIRGGVPVIFPWFGPRQAGPGDMHGFARTRAWQVKEVKPAGEGVRVVMGLSSDDRTRVIWASDFDLRFTVTFGATLDMQLEVKNTSAQPFRFEEALHTYFAVGDVRSIGLDGLGGCQFLDKNLGHAESRQEESKLTFTGQTDRVYLDTTFSCVIDDKLNNRRITVAKENSNSTVVWNPWSERIKSMPDLDATEWPGFVCVETCNVKACAVDLPAGKTHVLRATISLA